MHSTELLHELGRMEHARYVRDAELYRLMRRTGRSRSGAAAGAPIPAHRLLAAAMVTMPRAPGAAAERSAGGRLTTHGGR
jgi:hypothetical protein